MRTPVHFTGILGWPLAHTLSPAIHNAAFRRLGLDWVYLSWPCPPESLEAAVEGLRALRAMGANVTMPHKETVVAHLDQLSGDAISVGAVNTIQRVGDQLIGHNTDVDGFKKFLVADAGLDVRGSRVLVLGSGGAARAVVRACDELEATQIVLAARNDLRAADIARTVQGAEAGAVAWSEATDVVAKVDMIVNATPVQSDELLPGAVFLGHHAVVDLVYGSANSSLVERARVAGAGAWSGLGMLVHQAAASFRIWTGQDPPLETMSAAALHALSTSG